MLHLGGCGSQSRVRPSLSLTLWVCVCVWVSLFCNHVSHIGIFHYFTAASPYSLEGHVITDNWKPERETENKKTDSGKNNKKPWKKENKGEITETDNNPENSPLTVNGCIQLHFYQKRFTFLASYSPTAATQVSGEALSFLVLSKDTWTCGQEEPGIELPTRFPPWAAAENKTNHNNTLLHWQDDWWHKLWHIIALPVQRVVMWCFIDRRGGNCICVCAPSTRRPEVSVSTVKLAVRRRPARGHFRRVDGLICILLLKCFMFPPYNVQGQTEECGGQNENLFWVFFWSGFSVLNTVMCLIIVSLQIESFRDHGLIVGDGSAVFSV